jgi:hypothetical protein
MTLPQKKTDQLLDAIKKHYQLEKINPYNIFINYGPSGQGSRLTKKGFELMSGLFTSYKVTFEKGKGIKTKHLIILERAMEYPYYLTRTAIWLFSQQDAFMLQLNGSDLEMWGKSNGVDFG